MENELNKRLQNTAIIGAGGKMGRGISLTLLKFIATKTPIEELKKVQLILIDNSLENLQSLKVYLKEQLLKVAERSISQLRSRYKDYLDLIDNSEIVQTFIDDSLSCIHTSTDLNCCQNSQMVFEAVFEDLELKTKIYKSLKSVAPKECYYFSNTSSIPISEINHAADLNHRIIGFHFYNPPAVQKLVELIKMPETPNELINISNSLISSFEKVKVSSNDIAGFIGNSHFIREGLSVINMVKTLPHKQHESIYILNELIAKVLVRPMGMFQLIDYVGLDVFDMICSTMNKYINETFEAPLIKELLSLGIKGGQFGDGSQKDGFFKYDKNQISGVLNLKSKTYTPVKEIHAIELPQNLTSLVWKSVSRNKNSSNILVEHFSQLSLDKSNCGKYAKSILQNYIKIGKQLVEEKVTENIQNVDTVLQNGFFHLYGPGSKCLKVFRETTR